MIKVENKIDGSYGKQKVSIAKIGIDALKPQLADRF
tara:strand:- start:163 stop:270 length:108 start_codon:yes stop_codon:yes gene_type:complete